MNKKILVAILALSLAALAGCSQKIEYDSASVCFYDNSSTGYTWTYKCDPSITIEESFESSAKDKMVEGAGGYKTFTMTPSKDGTFLIVFEYARPWEEVEPEVVAQYSIKVENGKMTLDWSQYNDGEGGKPIKPFTIN